MHQEKGFEIKFLFSFYCEWYADLSNLYFILIIPLPPRLAVNFTPL
jgi:hypothetical protein